MALLECNIFSHELMMNTCLNVVLPQDTHNYRKGPPPKTLMLLHGISDNAAGWLRGSQAEVLAMEYGIALIMPEVQRSFYQDMRYGLKYYSYVSGELPRLCTELFNLSVKPEDLMVAGLSMGGYGALCLALNSPEKFSHCGAFSAACDFEGLVKNYRQFEGQGEIGTRFGEELTAILGEDMEVGDERSLFRAAEKAAGKPVRPKIYMSCGTEDFIRQQSLDMKDHLSKLGFDLIWEEWPGIHDWHFWNEALKHFLAKYLVKQPR
jgi:S-formylglutathione hydrolase FrmB